MCLQILIIITQEFLHGCSFSITAHSLYCTNLSTVVTCPILDEMDDGVIVYSSVATSTLMFGTIATHSCNNGFYLYGNDTRMCSENGTSIFGVWDTAAPICIGNFR